LPGESEEKMKFLTLTALAAMAISPLSIHAGVITLGTAASFGVLAGSTATNTGPSIIVGNVGVSPGTAITGFPPGTIAPPSTDYAADATALQAENDLTTAYNTAAGEPCSNTNNLTNQNLGGLILTPGIYCFNTSAQLTGTLTLNTEGEQNPLFVIQMESTLTTASNSSVVFLNDSGQGDNNVFWQVGSSATLGTGTAFAGDILALTSITLNTSADIHCGSALAQNGAVTLDSNDISICQSAGTGSGTGSGGSGSSASSASEPSTSSLLLLIGMSGLLCLYKSQRAVSNVEQTESGARRIIKTSR